jgi:hypothetical protein
LIESIINFPIPGHANTLSVTTENAIVEPNSNPITVTTGIMIVFSTCTKTTRAGDSPLARANLMKSISTVSRTPARTSRSTSEILNSAKLIAGIAIWRSPSHVRNDHCTPNNAAVVPRPVDGSHPSSTANTMISISPTQNVGNENPRILPAMMVRDAARSGYSPAYSPSGMPSTTDSSTAVTASSIVAGMRSAINRSAGSLNTKLLPRSPCTAPRRNTRYCCHSGLSRPSAAIARVRSAWSACGEIRISIGLPITCTPRNTMTVITRTTSMAWISRRISQVVIGLPRPNRSVCPDRSV